MFYVFVFFIGLSNRQTETHRLRMAMYPLKYLTDGRVERYLTCADAGTMFFTIIN
jgi:hypothetical protein